MPDDDVRTRYVPTDLRREVVRADPDWVKTRRWNREYEFSNGRKFFANYDERGAYGEAED